jgi:S1-C subfamily serine protease
MTSDRRAADLRTLTLATGLVVLVGLIAWPSIVGRIQYAKTRAELAAIRDAALGDVLTVVGKMFTPLARAIGPTVVNVTSRRRVTTFEDETGALRGHLPAGVTEERFGSGLIVDAGGLIVTNNHVVRMSDEIEVTLADGQQFNAKLVDSDEAIDLAILSIDATDLPAAIWRDSDTIEVGEMVWAIGNPFGLDHTLTRGIISALHRRVTSDPLQEFLQTDASINPGNSGGPLVDVHGHVMGITTAIQSRNYSGIGFAIPSNVARETVLRIGDVERGYLGMTLQPTAPTVKGVLVTGVEPGSPAALAGIRPGDFVVSYDGEPVVEPAEIPLRSTRTPIGERVPVGLVRDGRPETVVVQVGRRPR